MNPVCERPECMDRKRFVQGWPDTGHYDDDMNWVPHHFDETNHPSHSERVRLADHRKASDPEHCAKYGETLYHGTDEASARSIAQHGFHLDSVRNGRHSGHGIYLTKSKAEAHEYGSHVVEAHVDTSNFHDNPWMDEDHYHASVDEISGRLERAGHHGHIDPDDGAHVVYNPAHVHVVRVHGPTGKTAAVDYANETSEEKAARRADWRKTKPDVPEVPSAPKAAHTAFRGIWLGSSGHENAIDPSDPHQVMAKVLEHQRRFRQVHDWPHDPSNPDHQRQQVFGNHWSTDHETARRFAVRTVENQDRGIPNYNHRDNVHAQHGVVFEARMHEPAKEEEHYRGYGEKEVRIPSRANIHTLIAHVHTLAAAPEGGDDGMHAARRRLRDTHVHSFIVPDRHWRTASRA